MKHIRRWVLVVEDDQEMRQLICAGLEKHFDGHVRIAQAKDGFEATSKLQFQEFDCIITDLLMPKKVGQDFIQSAHDCSISAFTPIIVVSGNPDWTLPKKVPFLKIVEKPFAMSKLMEMVDTEMKLGRTHQRVPAEMINHLMKAIMGYCETIVHSSAQTLAPQIKKPEASPFGQVWCSLLVKWGPLRNRLVLSYEMPVALAIHHSLGGVGKADRVSSVLAAAKTIFSGAIANFASEGLEPPELLEMNLIDGINHPQYGELKSSKGIAIPVKTEHGTIYVQALFMPEKVGMIVAS